MTLESRLMTNGKFTPKGMSQIQVYSSPSYCLSIGIGDPDRPFTGICGLEGTVFVLWLKAFQGRVFPIVTHDRKEKPWCAMLVCTKVKVTVHKWAFFNI